MTERREERRVLVPLAPGFEEVEAVTIVDVLRRAGAAVTVAGPDPGPVTGSHGIAVVADRAMEEVAGERFDLVALPGGMPGTTHLAEDPRVGEVVQRTVNDGGLVAAICAAPWVLSRLGLLRDREATSHPSVRDRLEVGRYREVDVVADRGVITSRGPGTALAFALTLVTHLFGDEERRRLAQAMVFGD